MERRLQSISSQQIMQVIRDLDIQCFYYTEYSGMNGICLSQGPD
jgi:hypothetical protein